MTWEFRDNWTRGGYRRQIEGCTIEVLLKHNDSQHTNAARQLHNYCSFFGYDGPIVIGRGCHNVWRPSGFSGQGTRELYALEVFSPNMSRETFASVFGKTPDKIQYLPGEVILYGQGEMAVCLDSYNGVETAIPLSVFTSMDPCMADFPSHIPFQYLVSSSCGFHVLSPIWGLVVALGKWARLQMDINASTNNLTAPTQWQGELEYRQAAVADDIHDFRYLCYSQARYQNIRVASDDPGLWAARQHAQTYLRSFNQLDPYSEAERETATDHFIEIGLYARGTIMGPRYDLQGPTGWNI